MKRIVPILVLLLLVMNSPVHGDEYTINFELDLTYVGNTRRDMRFATYIQSALAPLGIKVNLIPAHMHQYAGDAYSSNNDKWDMILTPALVKEEIPAKTIDYYFTGLGIETDTTGEKKFLRDIMRYDNPEFQAHLAANNVNQSELNKMAAGYFNSFNGAERQKFLDEYSQYYIDNLLYKIPLVAEQQFLVTRKGLMQGFDVVKGRMLSAFSGASIEREEGSNIPNSVSLSESINGWRNFLYFQERSYLLLFDEFGNPHPDLAIQWELSNWSRGEETIENGKHKFWLRDDAYMEQSNIYNEANIEPYAISLKDFEFSYWIAKNTHPYPFYNTMIYEYDVEFNYTDNSITVFSEDPTFLDLVDISAWNLYPEGILNTTLTYYDQYNNVTIAGTPHELVDQGIDPRFTQEFTNILRNYLTTGPYMHPGPIYYENYAPNAHYGYLNWTLREKYHYPSELDSPGKDFIIHEPGPEEPYFFAYNGTEKPTTMPISVMNFTNYWGEGSLTYEEKIEMLRQGFYDYLYFTTNSFEDYDLLDTIMEDEGLEVIGTPDVWYYSPQGEDGGRGSKVLLLDMTNPDLFDIEVRRAIAMAIDRDLLTDYKLGYYHQPWYNPVPPGYASYNPSIRIEYDYIAARDLMRSLGYWAASSPGSNPTPVPNPTITTTIDASAPQLSIVTFAMATILLKRNTIRN